MSLDRIAQALLNQALRPPRRRKPRRRSIPGFGSGSGGNAALARALGQVAQVAIKTIAEHWSRPAAPQPPAPAPAPAPARRMPSIGRPSPWGALAPAPAAPRAEEREEILMLRAMIATAAIDGLDEGEQAILAEQLDRAGLTAPERDVVLREFDAPATAESLAEEVSDPMQAAQLYAAAYAAADEVSPGERAFLDRLRAALGLAPEAVAQIERQLDTAT